MFFDRKVVTTSGSKLRVAITIVVPYFFRYYHLVRKAEKFFVKCYLSFKATPQCHRAEYEQRHNGNLKLLRSESISDLGKQTQNNENHKSW
jgi:hypothetical protein